MPPSPGGGLRTFTARIRLSGATQARSSLITARSAPITDLMPLLFPSPSDTPVGGLFAAKASEEREGLGSACLFTSRGCFEVVLVKKIGAALEHVIDLPAPDLLLDSRLLEAGIQGQLLGRQEPLSQQSLRLMM